MNKRIKKKRELENSLRIAGGAIDFLLDQNNQLWCIIEKMEEVNSRNTQATNNRFDQLEAENKALRQEIEDQKRGQKKSFFKRK